MSIEQTKNYELLYQRLSQYQDEIEHTLNFSELRNILIQFRFGINEIELNPNAQKKFINWATKLLYRLNDRERETILAILDKLDSQIEDLKNNFTQNTNMEKIRKDIEYVHYYVINGINYLNKKPEKRHTFSLQELEGLKKRIDQFKNDLVMLQRQRSHYYDQVHEQLEETLISLEKEVENLTNNASYHECNRIFNDLRKLLDESIKFSGHKKESLRERILRSIDIVKIKKRELLYQQRLSESQTNKLKFEKILDSIENALNQDNLNIIQLGVLKSRILDEVKNPINAKTDSGTYEFNLFKEHKDELFNRIRGLLQQIEKDIQYVDKEKTENELIELRKKFEKYREDYYEGKGMNKHDLLKSLNEILQQIKNKHQELKEMFFLHQEKYELRESLNDLWSDITNFIQVVAEPTWSMEWLMQKIEMNKRNNNAFLQVIEGIPSPNM